MARHPSLNITDEQEANLRKLAAYLMTLPADYPDFEMKDFVQTESREKREYAHVAACGTAACAAGHGPIAGVAPHEGEDWSSYTFRVFTSDDDSDGQWEWCFGWYWSKVDNTVHGAARRILWMLEQGVPEDANGQRWGYTPLCYLDQQVPA